MSVDTAGLAAPEVKLETHAERLRFLLVEDNPVDVELLERALRRAEFDFTYAVVQTPEDFTRELLATRPHVVLADYNLPHWKGMEALEILQREGLDIPLILVTGALGDMTAVDCIKQGATDYVLKGALTRLPIVIRRALQEKSLRDQRQRAEEDLARKVEELARSNRDLEQFAYVASHDLQEPLRMVAAYTQLLAERYRGKLDENADKYIGYAVEGALRMQTLILDLLAFSRVGRAESGRKNGDCNGALKIAMANLQTAIGESGAVITYDELPSVAVDQSQLVQLFQNLLGNAIKFRAAEAPAIQYPQKSKTPHGFSAWLITASASRLNIRIRYLLSFNVCTRGRNTPETALAWQSARRSRNTMGDVYGLNQSPVAAPHFISHCRSVPMNKQMPDHIPRSQPPDPKDDLTQPIATPGPSIPRERRLPESDGYALPYRFGLQLPGHHLRPQLPSCFLLRAAHARSPNPNLGNRTRLASRRLVRRNVNSVLSLRIRLAHGAVCCCGLFGS